MGHRPQWNTCRVSTTKASSVVPFVCNEQRGCSPAISSRATVVSSDTTSLLPPEGERCVMAVRRHASAAQKIEQMLVIGH